MIKIKKEDFWQNIAKHKVNNPCPCRSEEKYNKELFGEVINGDKL